MGSGYAPQDKIKKLQYAFRQQQLRNLKIKTNLQAEAEMESS